LERKPVGRGPDLYGGTAEHRRHRRRQMSDAELRPRIAEGML
jgi:hypothetical protein